MAAPRAKDPKLDWGFHAVIPRIVRTEYKNITPPQKWAYVCLKDLCGETGTCYRTIRVLAEEIGLSVGMTSETIRVLHDAGLIHAEKKKRHTGGKEVWHITIVDIWAKNGQMHPTKCSPAEQECSPSEQTTRQQNVHSANVQQVNTNPEECSPAEQECSPAETEEESVSRIIIEAGSESTYPATSSHADESGSVEPTRTHSLSDTSQVKGTTNGRSDDNDHLLSGHARRDDAAVRGAEPVRVSSQQAGEHEIHPAEPGAARAGRDTRTESGVAQAGMVNENETYSQLSTSTGSYPQASAKVVPKGKRTRTPKPPKVSPEELDLYRRVFDDCYREALDDESVGYAHTKASDKCITDLLEANLSRPKFVTPKKLHAVYVHMWNLPKDERKGFWWREHMSIKAVCNNYETFALALTVAAKEKQQASRVRTEEEMKREVIERAQSGELLGGMYRYIPPAEKPLAYMTAEQHQAVFGGK